MSIGYGIMIGLIISAIISYLAIRHLTKALKQRKGCSRNLCRWQCLGECLHKCPFTNDEGYCSSFEMIGCD